MGEVHGKYTCLNQPEREEHCRTTLQSSDYSPEGANVKNHRNIAYMRMVTLSIILLFPWAMRDFVFAIGPTGTSPDSEFMGSGHGISEESMRQGSIQLAQKTTPPKAQTERSITINDLKLTNEKVKILENRYRIRILDGNYWYDKISGAWGYQGGPAVGLIAPFLDIGGPLKANASNGNTGVFINGRELHILDVRALQQLGPVYQGRYWINSLGYYGFEGGPALGNLWAAANSTGSRREGILSTYDKTGAVVIGQ